MNPIHPALVPGRVAVVTGAASGIGLAAALRFAELGLDVWMADRDEAALAEAGAQVRGAAPNVRITTQAVDVSDYAAVQALQAAVLAHYPDVAVLMNNAGVGGGAGPMDGIDAWRRVLGVNLWGVIHGVQAFAPAMSAQGAPGLIINTGSKQGITTPPGDTAYNVSKAGVKVLTEGLQHSLRNIEGCRITAHLLVPGFVFTSMTARGRAEPPAGAWTPAQTVDFMLEKIAAGDFYILCPDGETTPEMDRKRIAWAAGDLIRNRPPLSRWEDGFKDAFAAFMKGDGAGDGPP